MSEQYSRRTFIRQASLGAAALAGAGLLSSCGSGASSSSSSSEAEDAVTKPEASVLDPETTFDSTTGGNFNVEPNAETFAQSTLLDLTDSIQEETNSTNMYASWGNLAQRQNHDQIARLFNCTADAAKIHVQREIEAARKIDDSVNQPYPSSPEAFNTDLNVIHAAQAEIFKAVDMYPTFIDAATKNKETDVLEIFTQAKLASGFYAQLFLDAYNTIDFPDGATYYLCPTCGYIHKGDLFTACPICLESKDNFKAY